VWDVLLDMIQEDANTLLDAFDIGGGEACKRSRGPRRQSRHDQVDEIGPKFCQRRPAVQDCRYRVRVPEGSLRGPSSSLAYGTGVLTGLCTAE
jgi:hypothetical protein